MQSGMFAIADEIMLCDRKSAKKGNIRIEIYAY